jgi:hypothetical protein
LTEHEIARQYLFMYVDPIIYNLTKIVIITDIFLNVYHI